MRVQEHLLVCLAEEGAEIAHISSKALRFGIDDVSYINPTGPTVRERLVGELNDMMGVMELLQEHGLLPDDLFNRKKINAKKEKTLQLMSGYAREHGTLDDDSEAKRLRALLQHVLQRYDSRNAVVEAGNVQWDDDGITAEAREETQKH